ncbi:MAG: hypothetical protein H7Y07_16660 [Pyrinomonadaceae bacterium]|nr:hypothetical protein [Sphingobacteriaceae bacterium]
MRIIKKDPDKLILEQDSLLIKSILFIIMLIGILLIVSFLITDNSSFLYSGIGITSLAALAYFFLPVRTFIIEKNSKMVMLTKAGLLNVKHLNLSFAEIADFVVERHYTTGKHGQEINYYLNMIEKNGHISILFSSLKGKNIREDLQLIKSYFSAA